MMYLASQMTISSGGRSTTKTNDIPGHWGLTHWLNYFSTAGFFKFYGSSSISPKGKPGKTNMDKQIQDSIRHGVPAIVAARMYLLPSQANFPSSTSMHFVPVVAYDGGYYYYVDTCWSVEGCGHPGSNAYDPYKQNGGPQTLVSDVTLSKRNNIHRTDFDIYNKTDRFSFAYRAAYPGTWRISKGDLLRAVSAGVGWYQYSGPSLPYAEGY
jgi:hypothetical protein